MSEAARPVQLQANVAGAWKTVLYFDAADAVAAEQVQRGVQVLHEASPATSWRIATKGSLPVVLRHLGQNTYGLWVGRKEN